MKKEVVWVVLTSIFVGLVLAVGIYRINKRLNNQNGKQKPVQSLKPVEQTFKITLTKPENEDIETEDKISVAGLTKPDVWIVVSGINSDYLTKSDSKGNFNQEVRLAGGVNQIRLTAFDSAGGKSEEKVIVIYSSAFEKIKTENINTENSTDSAIQAKVQEKVNALLNKPKGYIGTVTDITKSTIELKSKTGEIKQISLVKEDITVVKASKNVKLTDIAIGDTIAALGYRDENQVLEAQRILVSPEIVENNFEVVFGTVSKITKNSLFLGETEYTFEKTAKIKFTSLVEDQKVIIVGKRSLFVLE